MQQVSPRVTKSKKYRSKPRRAWGYPPRRLTHFSLYLLLLFFMVLLFHIIAHFVFTQDQVFFIFVFYFYFDFAFHFAFCPHKNKNKNLLCHISLSLSLFFRWCFVIFVVSKLVFFLPLYLFIQLTSRTRFPFRRIQIWVSLDKQSLSTCPILGSVCDCGSFP